MKRREQITKYRSRSAHLVQIERIFLHIRKRMWSLQFECITTENWESKLHTYNLKTDDYYFKE